MVFGIGHIGVKLDNRNADDLVVPPIDARADLFTPADYLRPVGGGMAYGLLWSTIIMMPLLTVAHPTTILIAFAASCFCVALMGGVLGFSALIHHMSFLHRLRTYGPQYYQSDIELSTPAAEAFELCLAATSELPRSKIISVNEKERTMQVALKGNFWITVDRVVMLRVRETESGNAIVSIDPSVKLTKLRRQLLKAIWGDKWYALIARSDIKWNRKIIDEVSTYLISVPDWDHRHEPDAHWLKQAS